LLGARRSVPRLRAIKRQDYSSAGRRFVDIHTHLIPSGDDGVQTIGAAVDFCREASRRGTAILYATPHVNRELPLSPEREARVRAAHAAIAEQLDGEIDYRLGFELFPTEELLTEDPRRYQLDQLEAILVECPLPHQGAPGLATAIALAEHIESASLLPVLAHPERTETVLAEPRIALDLAERGWLLQITATSLLGVHGRDVERTAWRLLDAPTAVVASDGHRSDRPPFLDVAYAAVAAELGHERADALFRGETLLPPPTVEPGSRSA